MDEAREIIARMARERYVEQVVERMTGRPLTFDTSDLCQIVYVALLQYDQSAIVNMAYQGQLGFFILRIAKTQLTSPRSRYYYDTQRLRYHEDINDRQDYGDDEP